MTDAPRLPEEPLLRAALDFVQERYPEGCRLARVVVVVETPNGVKVEVGVSPADLAEGTQDRTLSASQRPEPDAETGNHAGTACPVPAPEPADGEPLTGRERAILSTLAGADRPLKQTAVARRCGARFNSYFRGLFTAMHGRRLVVHVEGENDVGWWLAGRPLPPGCRVKPA